MRELDVKNKRIESLREELKELMLLRDERMRKQQEISGSLDEDGFRNVARSRKSKEAVWANMGGDNSMN